MGPRMVVHDGSANNGTIDIGERLTVGRGEVCSIRFTQNFVSNEHCEIKCVSGGVVLLDHSSQGTFINQQKVIKGQEQPLRHGDRIEFGGTTISGFDIPPAAVVLILEALPPPDSHYGHTLMPSEHFKERLIEIRGRCSVVGYGSGIALSATNTILDAAGDIDPWRIDKEKEEKLRPILSRCILHPVRNNLALKG